MNLTGDDDEFWMSLPILYRYSTALSYAQRAMLFHYLKSIRDATIMIPDEVRMTTVMDESYLQYWGSNTLLYAILVYMRKIMKLEYPKVTTISFSGESNTGKSQWVRLLASLKNSGTFLPLRKYNSSFTFQDLPGKDLYICEEFCPTSDNVEQYLLVLEGSPFFTIDRKNQHPLRLARKPVLTSGKYVPWSCVSTRTNDFMNRCLIVEFHKPWIFSQNETLRWPDDYEIIREHLYQFIQ